MGRKRRYIKRMLKRSSKYSPKELASCYGKIRYGTYAEAKIAADASISRVKAYKCEFGVHYHKGKRRA